jgi:imidazolonepropionase-like amidohydrolase
MQNKLVVFAILVTIALLNTNSFSQSPQPLPAILIRDVRVFDGHRTFEHRSVLVANGKIAKIVSADERISGATEVIDGPGRTLLPGLIDCHVHVGDESSLRQSLVMGVTTVLDMFTSEERLKMMKRVEREDPLDMADVRTAGIGATAAGGHPTEMGGPPIPTVSSAADAQRFVDQRIKEGSDFIKIIYDDLSLRQKVPMLDQKTLVALVKAAHQRHKLVVVHIGNEDQARAAIGAHADGLAHLFFGRTSSSDFGRFAASHHVFVIPTLVTLHSACGTGDGKELAADPHFSPHIPLNLMRLLTMTWPADASLCQGADEAIQQLVKEGVPLLAGTDAAIPGTTYGASLHGELELLVKLGLTPLDALVSATSRPAHYFHLEDRGVIRRGARADLLLVEGDPTRDILSTRNIVAVFKRGMKVSMLDSFGMRKPLKEFDRSSSYDTNCGG